MTIDTINVVSKEVSKELEISETIVKKINAFYWKGLSECIRTGNELSIRLKGIGTLTVSRHKLWKQIKDKIKKIRFYSENDREFKRKTKEEYIEEQKKELKILLERRNELALLYKQQRETKKQRNNAKFKTNME